MRVLVCALFLVLPSVAQAAVTFSEIAWMGSAESPNDEWIELYNDSSNDVSLEGWFVRDGGSLEIPLSGTIHSGEYAVLERTDDDSAEGSAYLIYTGALPNTGGTLSLYRPDESLEDQVVGGENWGNIGGDNTSKETAQKTSQGWQTSKETPGTGLLSFDDEEEGDENKDEENEESSDKKKNYAIELQVPDTSLTLNLVGPDIAYEHQPITFTVESSGLGTTLLNSLVFEWNFGDFGTSTGEEVVHSFSHSGEYVITVYGAFSRHEQIARKTIKVLPVTLSLSVNSKGDLLIHNNAKYEVDISGYKIRGSKKLTFPERSILLPNATVTLSKEKIGSAKTPIVLSNSKGMFVASTLILQEIATVQDTKPQASSLGKLLPIASAMELQEEKDLKAPSNFSFVTEVADIQESTSTQIASSGKAEDLEEANVEALRVIPDGTLPFLGLVGVISLGMFAVFAGRRS